MAIPIVLISLGAGSSTAPTTRYVDNTDESKAGTYMLPDPLLMADGTPVRDAEMWRTKRRPELLELVRHQIYGVAPPPPSKDQVKYTTLDGAVGDTERTLLRIDISPDASQGGPGPVHPIRIDALIYRPAAMNAQTPVFLCFSFMPLHMVTSDPGVPLMDGWSSATNSVVPGKEADRGKAARGWPIDEILRRGYAIAIVYYQQIEPDAPDPHTKGIRCAYEPADGLTTSEDWGTIAAWAWGASRVMDYLVQQPDLDANRIAIVGHSRLGKTALWTGASDERFSLVIAAQSGRGGAAMARRNFGESIQRLTSKYGYQFCENYVKWASHVNEMPVDSNSVIALLAPRPFYQTASTGDLHSDPKGEFLAEVSAGAVYRLLGAADLGTEVMPPLNAPIMHTLGFEYRPGKHEISGWDWDRFLDFADLQWRGKQPTTRLAG